MKAIEQCKDEIAVKHGYMDFAQLIKVQHNLKSDHISAVLDEAMQIYAEQMCIRQSEILTEKAINLLNRFPDDGTLHELVKIFADAPLATDEA